MADRCKHEHTIYLYQGQQSVEWCCACGALRPRTPELSQAIGFASGLPQALADRKLKTEDILGPDPMGLAPGDDHLVGVWILPWGTDG